MLIDRPRYTDEILSFRDVDTIKVITGVRRCGKSSLLRLVSQRLEAEGIPSHRLITLNLESMEHHISNHEDLYSYLKERITNKDKHYLFIDEVQLIPLWEREINALRVDFDTDIYITGSNASLLSGQLATLLSGRYITIEVRPLVFSEYLLFNGLYPVAPHATSVKVTTENGDSVEYPIPPSLLLETLNFVATKDGVLIPADTFFSQFQTFGGLPQIALQAKTEEQHAGLMRAFYDTVIKYDVSERMYGKDSTRINKTEEFEKLCLFLADNIGNRTNLSKIAQALTRSGSSISVPTIKRYVTALSDAFVFYPIKRFDIKGKKCFDNPDKYYIVDVGLRNYLSHYKNADQGRSLENIVLLQLLYDGFDVTVGSLYQTEVDFIATKGSDTIYIQVTDSMEKEDTLERELKPLRSIRDAHTKIVVVGHGSYPTDIDGIKIITATNFLLGSN